MFAKNPDWPPCIDTASQGSSVANTPQARGKLRAERIDRGATSATGCNTSRLQDISLHTQVKAPENVYVAGDWIINNRMERHLVMISLRIKIDSEITVSGMSFLEFIS